MSDHIPDAAIPTDVPTEEKTEANYLVRNRELSLRSLEQDITHRGSFGVVIIGVYLPLWLLFVGTVVLYAGFKIISLSDAVLTTLLNTTTFNVIGLATIVLSYLFFRSRQQAGSSSVEEP
ncbi:MAG: hypothetical protein SFX74_09295 [Fimbriimonadaceae bacterium]|nr:hypothetical protein [Fimbriimonadaceae bacterium]